MTAQTQPSGPDSPAVAGARAVEAAAAGRGVTATWWYTASAILFFEVMLVVIWSAISVQLALPPVAPFVVLVGGVLWCASTVPPLLAYRYRTGETTTLPWRRTLVPLLVAAAYGVAAFSFSGLWMMLVMPVAQLLQLLDWPRSVRSRLVLGVSVLLVALWVVDARTTFAEAPSEAAGEHFLYGFFTAVLPLMTVLSLWWWDVLIALDRARVSEARLAATQERLSVATDVHDLQGHHLQVIALQLELAERLLQHDQGAALEQLKAARVSVDEARQGTRDLATRFRSVPLGDELANARDLLRAAGIEAQTTVAADADDAPAAVFGPVIRETTTNVLRHGGGTWARLALTRSGDLWRYEIRNDASSSAGSAEAGSGLDGISRRAGEAGGTVEVTRGEHEFGVVVTAPATAGSGAQR
ncbi:sensor histidine kinase [Herbiconiux sp. P15]|uniref:sensor histidine kinase n=1 Tax=Herbiconiux liukaitaii TaxID=3342799 RepID=UPI0035BB557A